MDDLPVIRADFATWRPVQGRGYTRPETRAIAQSRIMGFAWTEPNTGCWLWVGAAHPRGYGYISIGTELNKKASRYAYEAWNGPVGDLCVLHKCDTPACVNPAHLFVGTQKDNAQDRERKNRGNRATGDASGARKHPEKWKRGKEHHLSKTGEMRRGELNGRAKLTVEDVLAIRASSAGCLRMSRQYGVTMQTIYGIRTRRIWKHVP